ncbi:MAG: ATP-binding protein [Gammaproteobacteria bacterium]|nr:MAG: ATP-binding protein [Gammaproteobacteria bacterium]
MGFFELARAAPVRYALVFAAFLTLVMGILLVVIEWSMMSLLERHLEESVEQQIRVLRDDLEQDGRESMLGLVRQHAEKQADSRVHLLVQDRAGNVIAGDLPPMPVAEGWQDILLPAPADGSSGTERMHRGRGEWLDEDTYVLVTNDTSDLRQSRALIIGSFGIALAVTVVLALGGGFVIGLLLLRRVDAVNRTARAIIDGDLSRRIPVVGAHDGLGGLTEGLNRMLARIEELMESLRHVSSDIAHDLRTPLGRLRQRLEASRIKTSSSAEYEAAIDAAIEDTDAILKTFEAMLRIAQIEAGARRVRFADTDLSSIVENVFEAFAAVAEDEGKHLDARIESKMSVNGDRELLTQMLANLTENALRHTPPGTAVEVRLEQVNGSARLTVSDTGPGIPTEDREHVFRRFYRLDASRSTPGSGLGLSLVAAVAKLHDATISLEDNEPGVRLVIAFP